MQYAVLIMSRDAAEKYGVRPWAQYKAFSIVGTDPVAMLKGPAVAMEKVLQKSKARERGYRFSKNQ